MSKSVTLGPLEKEIMDVMWENCPCSVREVYSRLKNNRKIAYTTVMTVMTRLVEKGILCRDTQKKAHVYNVCLGKREVARLTVRSFFDSLNQQFQDDGYCALQEEFNALKETEKEKIRACLVSST